MFYHHENKDTLWTVPGVGTDQEGQKPAEWINNELEERSPRVLCRMHPSKPMCRSTVLLKRYCFHGMSHPPFFKAIFSFMYIARGS